MEGTDSDAGGLVAGLDADPDGRDDVVDGLVLDDAEEHDDPATDDDDGEDEHHRGFWTELPFLVLIALVLAIVLKTFVVQAFFIPSSSMEPTLDVGDRVLVNKLAYTFREPRRGEIVVFSQAADPLLVEDRNIIERFFSSLLSGLGLSQPSERDFIKRIIGLPGDIVEMRSGIVYVNGQSLPEEIFADGGYLSRRDLNDFGPVRVDDGHYFMLGDNRPNSSDSRFSLGQIPRDYIIGRAFVTIWPFRNAGTLPIASYDPEPPAAVASPAASPPAAVAPPAPAGASRS